MANILEKEKKTPFSDQLDASPEQFSDKKKNELIDFSFVEAANVILTIYKETLNSSPNFQKAFQDFPKVREYLNQNKDFPLVSIEYLAKTGVFHYFPKPTEEDTGYAEFYYLLSAMRSQSLLAHRFDFDGKPNLNDKDFELSGGYQSTMVEEMNDSFDAFVTEEGEEIVSDMKSEISFEAFTHDALREILRKTNQDVKRVVLKPKYNELVELLEPDRVMLLVPSLATKDMRHTISVSFFKDLCIITDKRDLMKSGAEIYQLVGNLDQKKGKKLTLASELGNSVFSEDNFEALHKSTKQLTAKLKKKLNMNKIGFIPLPTQYSGNCSWSSAAKSALLSALYFRIYETALTLKNSRAFAEPQQKAEAHKIAQIFAKAIHRKWVRYDRMRYLKKYIHQNSDARYPQFGPDPVLLACIQIKYQHRPGYRNLIKQIHDSGLVKPEHAQAAHRMAYEYAQKQFHKRFPRFIQILFGGALDKIAQRFVDLYFVTNKKNILHVIKRLNYFHIRPFHHVKHQLDQAIQRTAHPDYSGQALLYASNRKPSVHPPDEGDSASKSCFSLIKRRKVK